MLINKLKGGLGNQLFCYYSVLNFIKSKNNIQHIDIHDYTFFRKDRPFYLDKFNINFKIAPKKEIIKYRFINYTKIDYTACIKLNINLYKKKANQKIYLESENSNKNLLFHQNKIKNDLYIDGYWQNFEYCKSIKNQIISETNLKKEYINFNETLLNNIKKQNSVSVHIRRGDLLKTPFNKIYNVCSNDYYKNSIEYIKTKIEKPIFYIFTDDLEWAHDKFSDLKGKVMISEMKLNDYNEFFLMKNCHNHIIANSTFSLWAAWLGETKNSIVICPKDWFKKKQNKIHPNNWLEFSNT